MNISTLFNSHKMKYSIMTEYFNFDPKQKKIIYFFINFDYMLEKFLYEIDYHSDKDFIISEEIANEFLTEFLNIIAHYKGFFYKNCDTLSFFYIEINNTKYKKNDSLDKMVKRISKIITMIPRIYIIYHEKDDQIFYIKYNLIKKIKINKIKSNEELVFLDMSKSNKTELFFQITKNYHIFVFEDYKLYLYGYRTFKEENFNGLKDIYINSVIALLDVYNVLETVKLDKNMKVNITIRKYVESHLKDDFNDYETKINVLKLFSKSKELEKELKSINNGINNPFYGLMVEIIMKNWKHVIRDNNILKINEIIKMPKDKRINIETLINC